MWMTLLKWALRIIITFIAPILLATTLAPKGKFAPGMDFGTWFKQSGGCDLGTAGCDVTKASFCWGCDLFAKLIDFFSIAVEKGFEFLASDLILLLLFGTAIWFAWFTFTQMKIDGKVNGTEFLKKVIRRFGRVLIVLSLLGGISGVVGNKWISKSAGVVVKSVFMLHTGIVKKILNTPDGFCPKTDENIDGILSGEVKTSLLCTMGTMGLMTKSGLQAGGNMMFFATLTEGSAADIFLSERTINWLAGAYVFGAFLVFHLLIPFLLLDVLLTLIIPLFFLPLILVGYAFEGSAVSKHLDVAVRTIIKSAFKMVGLSIAFVFIYTIYSEVGDRYYPAPKDGFSYIFPNYLERKPDNYVIPQIEKDFKECYKLVEENYKAGTTAGTFIGKQKLKACAMGMQGTNLKNSNGWMGFLLLLGLMKISMKLFEKIREHIMSLFPKGHELKIGSSMYTKLKGWGKKGWSAVKNFGFKKGGLK
ncbi:MAG: hypothetical protein ACTSXL_04605 [Alphaproteobacteria bacterium]|nr:MAG: hypothetical protein B6I23_02615 [Rickettsiaceae bacterium 4572_127]